MIKIETVFYLNLDKSKWSEKGNLSAQDVRENLNWELGITGARLHRILGIYRLNTNSREDGKYGNKLAAVS